MRKNVARIMDAFLVGRAASDRAIHTDGHTVWSYDMPIAQRTDAGIECVGLRQAPTMTTKMHVSSAQAYLALAGYPYTPVTVLTGRAPHVFRRQQGAR